MAVALIRVSISRKTFKLSDTKLLSEIQSHLFTHSASEYRMPGCYMILEEVLSALDTIDGIVLFSIFMLPEDQAKRERIYKKVLDAGRSLHAALEDMALTKWEDVQLFEDVLRLNMIARTDQCMDEIRRIF